MHCHTPRFFSIFILTALAACSGSTQGKSLVPSDSIWTPPVKQSVYLRAVFDDDPSDNLGRFVKRGLANNQMDESNAFASRCSKYFTAKVVGSGGTFDETFTASSGFSASLSVMPYGKGKAGYGSNGELRVKYTLKKVMRAVVDADQRSQCCGIDGNQCSDKYIAEYYMGDGEVYQLLGSKASVEASGGRGPVDADVSYHNETAWKRVTKFENVYFAFKTALVGETAAPTDLCKTNWSEVLPQSLDGQFFSGLSRAAASEQAARQDAALDARRQTVQFIGVKLAESRVQTSKDLDAVFADESAITAASEGIAQMVKDRCWTPVQEVAGPTYRVKVKGLFFLPNSEIASAAKAIAEKLKATGKISSDDAAAIAAAVDGGTTTDGGSR